MEIQFSETGRGFNIATFKDLYGLDCSLQESSLATVDAIWFGGSDRMHLTADMVAELIPILQNFVDTGCLNDPKATGEPA